MMARNAAGSPQGIPLCTFQCACRCMVNNFPTLKPMLKLSRAFPYIVCHTNKVSLH